MKTFNTASNRLQKKQWQSTKRWRILSPRCIAGFNSLHCQSLQNDSRSVYQQNRCKKWK